MGEWLYCIDENDEVIGKVSRSDAHERMVLHRSGMIFLENSKGKIFLTFRSPKKTIFGGRYDSSAAFHVTYGESYEESAKREMKEELGVNAPLVYIGKFKHKDFPEYQFLAVFVCKWDKKITLDEKESERGGFYTKKEVSEIVAGGKVTPWLRDGWKLYLRR